MAYLKNSKSARVRARLDHPVVDGDGHWLEPIPIFLDYLRDLAGPTVVDQFVKKASDTTWYDLAPDERMRQRMHRPTWWGEPANTLDRATAMVPRLFYERLDDFGIDFCVLYTSLGLFYVSNPDEGIRRAVARAVNRMNAEMFRPFADRITPAAVVPMHTPEEAIEEATYAVRELGLRVLMIANHVRRPVPAFARAGAEMKELRTYVDSLAFESAYDYDPFWQRCADLKVAVTAHSGQHGDAVARIGVVVHLQPHRALRQRQPRVCQGPHPGRGHPSLPAAPLRLPGGRGGLGVQSPHRSRRPLGAAPARRDGGPDEAHEPRPPAPGRSVPPVRRAPVRGEDRGDLPLHQHRRGLQDPGGARPSAPTGQKFDDFAEVPVRSARSCGSTSPSASTSAARPTTRSRPGPSTSTASTACGPSSRPTSAISTWST